MPALFVVLGAALFALSWRRRRSPVVAAAVVVVSLGAATAHADPSDVVVEATAAREVRGGSLENVSTLLTREPLASAVLSPDADRVLVDLKTNTKLQLTSAPRAGFRPVWVDEHNVAHRLPKRPFHGEPLVQLNLQGEFQGPWPESKSATVHQADDVVWYTARGEAPRRLSPSDDRCFAPVFSARANAVAFQCLRTGVYVHRLNDKAPVFLGEGTGVAFAHDGGFLSYSTTNDDGHIVTESDVVVADLRGREVVQFPLGLTNDHERSPSLSRDGRLITYLVEEELRIAEVRLPPR
jgi:hypothetical protein